MSWTYNDAIKNHNWGKWTYTAHGTNEPIPVPKRAELDILKDILRLAEDRGFFKEMARWLKRNAPRNFRKMLNELDPCTTGWATLAKVNISRAGIIPYERMCEVLYKIGFRASDILERRMMLGPKNEWVQKYFTDFPPESP